MASTTPLTKRRGIGGHAAERLPLAAFAPPRPLVGAWDVAKRVDLTDGTAVVADLVVVALGVRPNTNWLEESGLKVVDGLVCDEYLRASRPHVWGAGDVVRLIDTSDTINERAEHWTSAVDQAEIVARNVAAGTGPLDTFRPAPYLWSDQHGLRIQTIGSTANFDTERVLHHRQQPGRLISLFGTAGRFIGAAAIGIPRHIARLRPLLAEGTDLDSALVLSKSQP